MHQGEPVHQGEGTSQEAIMLYTGSRNPVRVMMPKPARRPVGDLGPGRRPVVAVLDTGIGEHPWLPIGAPCDDPVVEVSPEFQQLLQEHEQAVADAAGDSIASLASPYEERDVVQPLLGLTDSHSGHGTFVTGLVHQTCADSRVLSLRVLHTDGVATEGAVLLALEWLRVRVQAALDNAEYDKLVDVVSLSLGFYPERGDAESTRKLGEAIERLTDLGVIVVAAAGNDSTTRPFVPAALGLDPAKPDGGNPLVAAVGALNAGGVTTAAFSNYGGWITRWAPGNALVSTVPIWQGAAGPGLAVTDGAGAGHRMRTSPDMDDLTSGFAVWAGTSFATPVIAGLIAAALACDGEAHDLDERVARARRAMDAVDKELAERGWR